MTRRRAALAPAVLALALAGCGQGARGHGHAARQAPPPAPTTTVQVVAAPQSGRFDPAAVYRQTAPSVVTVISVFRGGGGGLLGGGGAQAAEGSGFVVSTGGEIATNAHVVTTGENADIRKADQVYVKFAAGDEVGASVVGFDPNADVALLRISPAGLHLRPLAFAPLQGIAVGAPVAAIGSPFGEPQSLSVGVISATQRSIESLNGFAISGALQTDAAVNHGNSGGPLLDAHGRVLGINSQIKSTGGGGEGVGFAVPTDVVRRSLDQLRRSGRVRYAYLGVETTDAYPQLSRRFGLGAPHGAWVQRETPGGPAAKAGLHAGTGSVQRFQAQPYRTGGDVIVAVGSSPVSTADDLGQVLGPYAPGQRVKLTIVRGGHRRGVELTLGERPVDAGG